MTGNFELSPRRTALTIFFVSVVVNALLGIVALFAGDFDETQGKVLLTSLSISAASVMSLAMFPARERNTLGPIPEVGVALAILGFTLLVVLVWGEYSGDALWKTAASALTLASVGVYASLTSLSVVLPKYVNVVRLGYGLAAVLGVMIVVVVWAEPGDRNILRIMGTISILLAAVTVSIPVLHRMSRSQMVVPEVEQESLAFHVFLDREPTICLNCGKPEIVSNDDGTYHCDACGTRFRVEVRN